jgi:multiple sugar transport system permease protein
MATLANQKTDQTTKSKPRELRTAALFLAPMFVLLAALTIQPILGTLEESFFRDVVFLPRKLAGLANYTGLFADPQFWSSLRFTLLFVLVSVPLEVAAGLVIALVLHESLPFRGLWRACVLIPWAIPAAVSGRLFQLVYNYSYGAANQLLHAFHLSTSGVNWLGTAPGAFLAVVAADAWKSSPFAGIILLAGLSAIPEDLYRQAAIDRAGAIQRFRFVTVPLLKPVLLVVFLFRTIQAICIFDVIFVLTRGGPGGATESVSILAYRYFGAGDFGYGSAISVLLFLAAFALSLLYVRIAGWGGNESWR